MSLIESWYLWIITSLLHNLVQVRLESVPAGESWSVEIWACHFGSALFMLKINVHVRRQKAGQKTLRSMALLSSCSNVHVRRQKAGHKKLSSMAPLSSHSMCMSPHGWRRCKNFTQVTTAWSLVCKIREAYACTLEIWLNINYIGILCCQMWELRNTVFTNCKRQQRQTSLLLDSCFSIVSEPEQAACSKRAVQIQLAEV